MVALFADATEAVVFIVVVTGPKVDEVWLRFVILRIACSVMRR